MMSLMMISDNVYCYDEDSVPRVNSDVHCVEPLANNKGCFFLFSIFSKTWGASRHVQGRGCLAKLTREYHFSTLVTDSRAKLIQGKDEF